MLRNFKATLLAVLLSFASNCAYSDDSEVQLWTQYLAQIKLGPQLRLWGEFQPRYGFSTEGFTTLMLRPGLGWQFSPNFTVWAGYAWTPLLKPTSRDEHRIWIQGMSTFNWGSVIWSGRIRLEDRFIENFTPNALRLRIFSRFLIPVAQESPWGAAIYYELFFAFNDSGSSIHSGFDQNRLFLGANYKFCSTLSVDFGYLWNAVNRSTLDSNRTNHVIMMAVSHSL